MEKNAKVGRKGRVCSAMTRSLIFLQMHPSQDLYTPRALSLHRDAADSSISEEKGT